MSLDVARQGKRVVVVLVLLAQVKIIHAGPEEDAKLVVQAIRGVQSLSFASGGVFALLHGTIGPNPVRVNTGRCLHPDDIAAMVSKSKFLALSAASKLELWLETAIKDLKEMIYPTVFAEYAGILSSVLTTVWKAQHTVQPPPLTTDHHSKNLPQSHPSVGVGAAAEKRNSEVVIPPLDIKNMHVVPSIPMPPPPTVTEEQGCEIPSQPGKYLEILYFI